MISRPASVRGKSVNLWWRCSMTALCPVFSCAATVAESTEKDPHIGLWEICHLQPSTTDDPIFIGQRASLAVNHPYFKEWADRERWEGESDDASLIFVRTLTGIVCNLTLSCFKLFLNWPWRCGWLGSGEVLMLHFFVCNVIVSSTFYHWISFVPSFKIIQNWAVCISCYMLFFPLVCRITFSSQIWRDNLG